MMISSGQLLLWHYVSARMSHLQRLMNLMPFLILVLPTFQFLMVSISKSLLISQTLHKKIPDKLYRTLRLQELHILIALKNNISSHLSLCLISITCQLTQSITFGIRRVMDLSALCSLWVDATNFSFSDNLFSKVIMQFMTCWIPQFLSHLLEILQILYQLNLAFLPSSSRLTRVQVSYHFMAIFFT